MEITKTVKEKIFDALITAATFVAAVSWRETLIRILEKFLPGDNADLWSEIIVTSIITIIVIVLIVIFVTADKTIDSTFNLQDEDNKPPQN